MATKTARTFAETAHDWVVYGTGDFGGGVGSKPALSRIVAELCAVSALVSRSNRYADWLDDRPCLHSARHFRGIVLSVHCPGHAYPRDGRGGRDLRFVGHV